MPDRHRRVVAVSGALAFAFGALVFVVAYIVVKEIVLLIVYLKERIKHGS